jgi:redox-sensitive bicupin YhaK (pirin superfamily)
MTAPDVTGAAAVELTIAPRTRPVGSGTVERLLPFRQRRMVGPFIFVDHIGPEELAPDSGRGVDAHPHIGLSTLTYLLEGRMVHRDSTGAVQTIEPGDVNWMTAGAGVTHTERPHPDDQSISRPVHGLQMWVALPGEAEELEPRFEHHQRADIPTDGGPGARVTVSAGTGWGLVSPVGVSSPLVLATVDLDGGSLPIPVDHAERAVVALYGGLDLDGHRLPAGHLVVLRPGSSPRLAGTGRVVVLGGEPVGRRHIWWNFVHSDLDRIEQAKADWRAQRFPTVPGDHEPWVPLPG